MICEQFLPIARGGILYDASRIGKPDESLFEREYWRAQQALEEVRGGRGSISVLRSGEERWVLRHYRRGGFMARLSNDRYLWIGQAHTRSFAEWRLLAQMREEGLPVPAPIAARYVRDGFTYSADLITEHLGEVQTLAQAMRSVLPEETWREVGATIAAFHRAGVQHADLNAHNVILRASQQERSVFLLDFDRGRRRARGAWEQRVLQRLHRSLEKIRRADPATRFGEHEWDRLLHGYRGAL